MNGKKLIKGTVLTMLCAAMLYMNSTVSRAYQIVVVADAARVRSAASTESDVMASVKKGEKLEVVSEEQGGDGKTWYKVSINNATGYVRSDTVEKASDENTQVAATAQPVEASSSSVVEPMTSQAATVNVDDVNVRADASTKGEIVAKLKNGAAVTLTGTISDGSGKKWYQVNFINNGSNVTGYIREDFVEPGEVMEEQLAESTGGEDAELANLYGDMPTEEEVVNNDYELVFEADAEGVNTFWYIHDNVAQKRYKLEQLLQADEINLQNMDVMNKEVRRLKIVLLIVVVLLVLALLAVGFLGFKYHELRDEDDDEEDYRAVSSYRKSERQPTSAGRRKEAPNDEERSARGTPVRRNEAGVQRRPANGNGQRRPEREEAGNRNVKTARPGAEAQSRQSAGAGRSAQAAPQNKNSKAPSGIETLRKSGRSDVEWKSKNFLAGEEDELDFSFINGADE